MSVPEQDHEMPLIAHLIELRSRLLRAVLAVLLVFVALVPFANKLYSLLAKPLLQHLPKGTQMIAIDVIAPFLTPIKLAFFTALIIAMPVVLYQLWAFVAPGLYRHEKRLAKPILFSAVLLFYAGCAFAYFIVMPMAFKFLVAVAPSGVTMSTDINLYLNFVLVLFLAFGLCFEVPVAVVILVLLGWVTPAQLREQRGYVIVGVFVIAAVITPPDAISQLLLAIPMCILFEIGVLAASVLKRQSEREAKTQEPSAS